MKELKNYKIIETDDGSQTLFSELYGEACHSTSGARKETVLHYIQGCRIQDLAKSNEKINILEVGFGVGIGFEETLKVLDHFYFTSLEIDEELVKHVLNNLNLKYEKKGHDYYAYSKDWTLEILIGNARERVKDLKRKYHAIYQDAFSPKRNPDLWTKEWFLDLKNIAEKNCLMSTYSASSSVRKAMLAAGWKVKKGEKFGPKRSSTRASQEGISDEDILEQLKRSPAPLLEDNMIEEYKL